ncbi:MAG: iron-sulfur cluster assembly accessory protein [Gammaproteobacteria bacterium]|nr:iron-sulfur cluster assembly accessory protein [Gammaproteobacteria bacterium]
MTQVASHIPQNPLECSDAAIKHLRGRLRAAGAPAIKLGLVESGCSGYMYELDFVESDNDSLPLVQVREDVPIFVPRSQLPMLQGTRVDYVTEGLNSMLKFENPRAEASCGCGESFAFRAETNAESIESPSSNAD